MNCLVLGLFHTALFKTRIPRNNEWMVKRTRALYTVAWIEQGSIAQPSGQQANMLELD